MGVTGSHCTEGWWSITENTQLHEKVHVLEQKCATTDASYIAIQTKCDALDQQCQQIQLQLNLTRIEMQKIMQRVHTAEQSIASLDLQQHAMLESDIVVLHS
jgi:chromosome segregation ATPase